MTSQNSMNRNSWEVAYGRAPLTGSKTLPQSLDFSISNPIGLDLILEQEKQILEYVQSLYLDNSGNGAAMTVRLHTTNQTVIVPAYAQAYLPVLASADNFKATFTTAGTPLIPIQFLNFPVAPLIWQPYNYTPGSSTGLDHSSAQPALSANLLATAAVNLARTYIEVQNQSAEQIQVVLDDGAGNNTTVILLASGIGANAQGGGWTNSTFKGRVRIFSATALDQVAMYEN